MIEVSCGLKIIGNKKPMKRKFLGGEMMRAFKVNITETYTRTIEVEAED